MSRTRAGVAYLWVEGLGRSGATIARAWCPSRNDLRDRPAGAAGGDVLAAARQPLISLISLQRPLFIPEELEAVRQLAREKAASSSSLLRPWIRQRLKQEQRRAS